MTPTCQRERGQLLSVLAARAGDPDYCCSARPCWLGSGRPQFPLDGDAYPEDEEECSPDRCPSFTCTRCGSTVGWCRGSAGHVDPRADQWCDGCISDWYVWGEGEVVRVRDEHDDTLVAEGYVVEVLHDRLRPWDEPTLLVCVADLGDPAFPAEEPQCWELKLQEVRRMLPADVAERVEEEEDAQWT